MPDENSDIYLLGYDSPLTWSFDEASGLTIALPAEMQDEDRRPCKHAFSFKIRGTATEASAQ